MKNRTCIKCRTSFPVLDGECNNRCQSCRDLSRNKTCRGCSNPYRDESLKSTRRYCDTCQPVVLRPLTLSDNLKTRRNQRSSGIDDLASIPLGSTSWWGRVGEKLFLYLYPDAQDMTSLHGNKSPFDALHLVLGKVSVKTARRTAEGFWKFQLSPADNTFMLGFSRDGACIEMGWLTPSSKLPTRLKVQNPTSREYDSTPYELDPSTLGVLNRQFQVLKGLGTNPRRKVDPTLYERNSLGKLGERIYAILHPQSDHVALRIPNSPHDFLDEDGTHVNVRARRPNPDGRWTWVRAPSHVDEYWLLGLDPLGLFVEAVFRVPEPVMPKGGFSYRAGSDTHWESYRDLTVQTPFKVSDLLGSETIDFQIELGGLTPTYVAKLSPDNLNTLIDRTVSYYTKQGFPYPDLLPDSKARRELELLGQYQHDSLSYPHSAAGIRFLNPYMPHRYNTRNHAATFSAVGAFENPVRLRRTVATMFTWKNLDFSPSGLRSNLTVLNRTPGHFPPAVACALVREFCPSEGLVLDPCAGWGGRLLGTLVAGRSYLGIESWSETATALHQISTRAVEMVGGSADIRNQSFLDLDSCKAQMILTCPPYWEVEQYAEQPPVSLDSWIQDFVYPFARKCRECLDLYGHLVLVMQDATVKGEVIPLVSIWSKALGESGFVLKSTREMTRRNFGKASRNHDKVLIWQSVK